ncbi:MAG: molybdopterin molybdotransferase MoeA [Deltaproteobacteria bacterium]|nr:molybdopterin molybdotransferase MoeA [Deltaproteobacteria bacterium]
MISVKEAEELILSHSSPSDYTLVDIQNIQGEVLRQPIVADRDYPPFNRVAMDGIAISYSSWKEGRLKYHIENCQRAGEPQKALEEVDNCIEVMTGAPLPEGTDTVIRYEDVQITDGSASIDGSLDLKKMQNVHQQGTDCNKGDVLDNGCSILNAPYSAILAAVGFSKVQVSLRPVISVVSTGDELVRVDDTPSDFQIRQSNSDALISSLRANGFNNISNFHLRDDEDEILSSLGDILDSSDVIIISGGVSKGKFDFIPGALIKLGAQEVFHKVKQRPGKPLWFGIAEENKTVFGLPGNPVSSLICLHRYVLPSLWKSIGINLAEQRPYAVLEEDYKFEKELTYFLPVKITYSNDGTTTVKPITLSGSGDFTSLAKSTGFIELEENTSHFEKGKAFPLYLWRG